MLLLSAYNCYAQNTFNAAAANAILPTMEHTFSVGEMAVIHTAVTNNITVTQGLLQPVLDANNKAELNPILQEVNVYPNPSSNTINVAFVINEPAEITITLLDQTGKRVLQMNKNCAIGTTILPIVIEALPEGIYNLNLTNLTANNKQQYNCKISKR